MSKLRPECGNAGPESTYVAPTDALYLIREAVARRRGLAFGHLHWLGRDCAIGAFFNDNPKTSLDQKLIDLVAAVNDSHPEETAAQRWRRVNKWLKWKVAVLKAGGKVFT